MRKNATTIAAVAYLAVMTPCLIIIWADGAPTDLMWLAVAQTLAVFTLLLTVQAAESSKRGWEDTTRRLNIALGHAIREQDRQQARLVEIRAQRNQWRRQAMILAKQPPTWCPLDTHPEQLPNGL